MNFLKALIGTCKGTRIFSDLLSQSLLKSLWHLFLLALFCSLFITLCTYPAKSQKVNDIFAEIEEKFGKIQLSKDGIKPEKVNKTSSLLVADNLFRVTYIMNIKNGKLPKIDADDVRSGFLWTPTMLAFWGKTESEKFILFPFAYHADRLLYLENIKRSSMLNYIKNNTSLKNKLISPYFDLSWNALNNYFKNGLVLVSFLADFVGILLQVLLFVMMFSFILNLSARGTGAPVLKYKTRYIIGIYASFPPLLIATMFRAFELPFFSFNSVYVISFSIYLIVVYTHLQLSLNAGGQDKIEQQKS